MREYTEAFYHPFAGWSGPMTMQLLAGVDDSHCVNVGGRNRTSGVHTSRAYGEETPWQCEYCFKYYGSSNSLRNHRSVYHRRVNS